MSAVLLLYSISVQIEKNNNKAGLFIYKLILLFTLLLISVKPFGCL